MLKQQRLSNSMKGNVKITAKTSASFYELRSRGKDEKEEVVSGLPAPPTNTQKGKVWNNFLVNGKEVHFSFFLLIWSNPQILFSPILQKWIDYSLIIILVYLRNNYFNLKNHSLLAQVSNHFHVKKPREIIPEARLMKKLCNMVCSTNTWWFCHLEKQKFYLTYSTLYRCCIQQSHHIEQLSV